MPLIASKTIIVSISLFHMTLAFFFLTSPRTVSDKVLVYVMGESMGIPISRGFDTQHPALAFLAVVLAMFGLSDLVSLSMPEELGSLYYWGTQAPLRSFFSMLLVFYSYFLGPSSPVYGAPPRTPPLAGPASSYTASGWGGDALKNRVFFTFMFLEMISWFWIWVTLREERHGVVERLRKQRSG
ncbi:hypothetical protein TOPH_05298 [Tolypocladium ophioglossoides CBS 100239]|uniref:Increased loss of mitochondrial DNA protein 1 n=1 Tax=Tolypocladium ophioglossoides (strain CBS 100239) TaxID=1163406 RepID=A0A0L0N7W3_TOLOC|nr:hypothetical protein TOPH_05298 [Tolypocladium ophioglossoides CBS 100239]